MRPRHSLMSKVTWLREQAEPGVELRVALVPARPSLPAPRQACKTEETLNSTRTPTPPTWAVKDTLGRTPGPCWHVGGTGGLRLLLVPESASTPQPFLTGKEQGQHEPIPCAFPDSWSHRSQWEKTRSPCSAHARATQLHNPTGPPFRR